MPLELSLAEARVLSLRQSGVDAQQDASVLDVVERLGLLQVDSVNVFERAHYMPLFSRLGKFDKADLENLMGGFHPTLIEYWAHEASIIKLENWPLYRWRMDAYRDKYMHKWGMEAGNQKLVDQIKRELRDNGPMATGAFESEANQRKGNWWGWSDLKRALEYMFLVGDAVSGGRDAFKRLYALPEQILPPAVLNHSPAHDDARRQLLEQAALAGGVSTLTDLLDWHRMKRATAAHLVQELVDSGTLVETHVEGWKDKAFVHKDADLTDLTLRSAGARTTILSPFDPVCWHRDRIERMFGFEYRIEIYTPEPKRVFGYYTLPILHDRQLVGRIDLKSNRQTRQLMVQSVWHEESLKASQTRAVAKALAKHLKTVQSWQGLNETVLSPKGNLALELSTHLA
ncbi:MAG: winged helix-turn-helix domain-containing protein [Microbacteriaceae bacterium]